MTDKTDFANLTKWTKKFAKQATHFGTLSFDDLATAYDGLTAAVDAAGAITLRISVTHDHWIGEYADDQCDLRQALVDVVNAKTIETQNDLDRWWLINSAYLVEGDAEPDQFVGLIAEHIERRQAMRKKAWEAEKLAKRAA